MKTGLFFGSFNPIHYGHLRIAEFFLEHARLDQIWFIVSPHNPLKRLEELEDENHRLKMVKLGVGQNPHFIASDIEFKLSKPSFTADTLKKLIEEHPAHKFSLILGTDAINQFEQWKNYSYIMQHVQILVYPRNHEPIREEFKQHDHVHLYKFPEIDISATAVRSLIQEGKSISHLVTKEVAHYIQTNQLYRS